MEETETINEKVIFPEVLTGFSQDSKRPRMEPVTPSDSGKNRFELPDLSVFWKSTGCVLTQTTFPKSEHLTHTAEDTQLQVYQDGSSVAKVTTLHPDEDARVGCLEKDEQLPVIRTDEPISHPGDDGGDVSADSHSWSDTGADTSTRHDCEGNSLERQPPGGDSLPSGYNQEKRQWQEAASPIQKSTLSLSEIGEVKCQPDCAHEDELTDALPFHTSGPTAEVEWSNQKGDEHGFSEGEEASIHAALLDYGDTTSLMSYIQESHAWSSAQVEGNYRKVPAFYENGVTETGAVHDGFGSNNCDPESGECARGTAYEELIASAIMDEGTSISVESDNPWGASEGHAAGKMRATVWGETADRTPETQMPARIRGQPAGGDNDAGSLTVIDPAVRSETDEDDENFSSSLNTAGTGLSQSTIPLPGPPHYNTKEISSSDQTGGDNSHSEQQRHKGNQGHACQSSTEELHCFISAGEPHNKTLLFPPSSSHRPTQAPPAGGDIKESHGSAGHLHEEQDPANCFPITPVHLASYSPTENAPTDRMTQRLQGRAECFGGDLKTVLFVNSVKSEEALMGQNEIRKAEVGKVSTHESVNDLTPCRIGTCDDKSTFPVEEERRNKVTDNMLMVQTDEQPLSSFTSPPLRDAVVPGPCYLNSTLYAQNADSLLAQHCDNRSSPVPSAPVLSDRVPQGFDTFEKIQLTPDDDDGGLGHSPLLASPLHQLYPPPQCFMPEAESELWEKKEQEVEANECQREIIETTCFDLENSSCEVSNLALTTHNPVPQPCPQSGLNWSEPVQFESNISDHLKYSACPAERDVHGTEDKFEMKEEFDLVMEELSMFFEISTNDASLVKADLDEKPSGSGCGEWSRRPAVEDHKETLSGGKTECVDDDEKKQEEGDNGCSLQTLGGANPGLSCANGGSDHEQEVPLDCSHLCQEVDDSMYPSRKHTEPRPTEEKSRTWTPSFTLQPIVEHLSQSLPDTPRRLQPLTTCTRPIRVGLSKRVKTSHLHHLHPYK